VHCEKLGKLLHEETEIHVLSFTLQSVWHLADVGVLVHVRFAPKGGVQKLNRARQRDAPVVVHAEDTIGG